MRTLKILTGILMTFAVAMTLAWLGLNIAMGCGLVNDWAAPECMSPFEMMR
jgi:hypothetical protein